MNPGDSDFFLGGRRSLKRLLPGAVGLRKSLLAARGRVGWGRGKPGGQKPGYHPSG